MNSSLIRRHLALLLCFAVGAMTSCREGGGGTTTDYIQTVQSGIKTLPWPREMEAMFGEGDHFITHYGFSHDPQPWNSQVFLYGRYSLTLQVNVEIDYKNHSIISSASAPKFFLLEVKSVEDYHGRPMTKFSGQWVLDESKWRKLVEAKGDWSAIGIPVVTNSPVSGFEDYVKGQRAALIKIPRKR